jgi:hypothetical protein
MEQAKENGGNQETGRQVDLSLLLDVPLQVTVELGRTRMTIESLLKLTQGSVVELNQIVGEPRGGNHEGEIRDAHRRCHQPRAAHRESRLTVAGY